jgi:hypothetical protein
MNELQFHIALAVAPVLSLMIVIAGYVVQNNNLNVRVAEMRADFRDVLRAELGAVRAEAAKNHSEVLFKLAELENRIDARLPRAERQP